jgi:23S rRNA (uracil1939-C5)-methyltransferase
MKVQELLNIELGDLALGGQAVARHEGRVVFVEGGIPGDRVQARVTKVRRTFAEARVVGVESPSALRVAAQCPHVPVCGGCRFQELAYPEQLRAKARMVAETLVHLGGIPDPNVMPIVPAPEPFGYRNKMELTFLPEEGTGRPLLGMHRRGAFDRVFELETCLLCSELTRRVTRHTQAFAAAHGWRAYHPREHHGMVRILVVRHLPLTAQCAVHLVAASFDVPEVERWAREIAALSPEIRTVTLNLNRSRGNVAFSEEERILHGDGKVAERLLGLDFEAGMNAFLQTNSRQAEALYAEAIGAAELRAEDVVLDVYCGTGTLTLALARGAREAIGVESVADATAVAVRNAERNGIANARFVTGEARAVLRQWARGERPDPPRPQVVVVDPPRAGLHPRVVARVAELAPRRIVYVSCNPATLARDLKDFALKGYALEAVRPFDMFPHTAHIECVARLNPMAS